MPGRSFTPRRTEPLSRSSVASTPRPCCRPPSWTSLRGASTQYVIDLAGPGELKERPELLAFGGVVVALAGLGFAQNWLAVAGGAIALMGLALRALMQVRAERVAAALHRALSTGDERERAFARLADTVGRAWKHDWIGLVSWDEDGLGGTVEHARGDDPPSVGR